MSTAGPPHCVGGPELDWHDPRGDLCNHTAPFQGPPNDGVPERGTPEARSGTPPLGP